MISVWQVIVLLLGHCIGDFVLQSNWVATNKSKNNEAMFLHVFTYGLVMVVFFWIIGFPFSLAFLVGLVWMGLLWHFIIDLCSSKLTSYFYAQDRRHAFFLVIGVDQLLHMIVLLIALWVFGPTAK